MTRLSDEAIAAETPLRELVARALGLMALGSSMRLMETPGDSSFSSHTFSGQVGEEIVALIRQLQTDLAAMTAERDALRGVAIDCAAHLSAAISLLERGGNAAKKAASSNKMFDIMLQDYRASLSRARAALNKETAT